MSDDLLRRLRYYGQDYRGYGIYNEAAERIDKLNDRIKELEQQLGDFKYEAMQARDELAELLGQTLNNIADINGEYGALVTRRVLGRK